MVQKSTLN